MRACHKVALILAVAAILIKPAIIVAQEKSGEKPWYDGLVIELENNNHNKTHKKPKAGTWNDPEPATAKDNEEGPPTGAARKRAGKRKVNPLPRDEEWYKGWETDFYAPPSEKKTVKKLRRFGNDLPLIRFENAGAEILASTGTEKLHFKLDMKVSADSIDADEYENVVQSAWVYYSENGGADWERLSLERATHTIEFVENQQTGRKKDQNIEPFDRISGIPNPEYKPRNWKQGSDWTDFQPSFIKESWEGEIDYDDYATEEEDSNFIYFFQTKASNGNITTELPLTQTAWPPDKNDFLQISDDIYDLEANPDVSYVISRIYASYDGKYINLALREPDKISPGTLDSTIGYGFSFQDPGISWGIPSTTYVSFLPGQFYLYFPSHYYNFRVFTTEEFYTSEESHGRLADLCFNYRPFVDNSNTAVAIGDNTLYTRIPIESACANECQNILLQSISVANKSGDFDIQIRKISPLTLIYLRSHSLYLDRENASAVSLPRETEPDDARYVIPGADEFLDSLSAEKPLSAELLGEAQERYKNWIQNFFEEPVVEGIHLPRVNIGRGPFNIEPCDIVAYENLYIETYTRNRRIKARVFDNGRLEHTMMIGIDTKAYRDQEHRVGKRYITLSGFDYMPSCQIKID